LLDVSSGVELIETRALQEFSLHLLSFLKKISSLGQETEAKYQENPA